MVLEMTYFYDFFDTKKAYDQRPQAFD